MPRASLVLVLFTTACTTTEPDTSPGELTLVLDQAFICDEAASDASWACSIELTLAGTRLTSVGIDNDGSTNGPASVATLSQTAVDELDALIATVPMSVDGVDGVGCGLGPIATRAYTIDFETGGVRELMYHAAESGPLRDLKNRVTGLITAIDTCTGNGDISFTSCSPRIAPPL
jgi:hypothetical protein